jgi:hydrogenase maturation protein HypF
MTLPKRFHINILGCVQGVGFRPFIYRLAHQYHLLGTIKNTNSGVFIDIQGEDHHLSSFQSALISEKPTGAIISEIRLHEMPLHPFDDFKILDSDASSSADLPLMPDTAICQACLHELFNPSNRRYRYPFVHCVSCGPRFSLFLRMPFDRNNTSMKDFVMCSECRREYDNPDDRRFFSQTNCCPACGPKIILVDRNNTLLAGQDNAIHAAIEYLRQGKIVSIKNTGGHQLLVDALNEQAVKRLRIRKKRAGKPFALLMPTLEHIKKFAIMTNVAEQLLLSPAAPIVLLNKISHTTDLAPSVASESPYLGIMLPHNALQHMIIHAFGQPLVATSGNLSDGPLCINDEDALTQLSHVADLFLLHNRQIVHALDDSVVHVIGDRPMLIRRARGYIPYTVPIPSPIEHATCPLIAVGTQLKNTFAFAKEKKIYISQHIGNLDSVSTCLAYDQSIEKWEKLLALNPSAGVGDKHPGYYSSEYLQRRKMKIDWVQHHQAHVWAGMADNQLHSSLLSAAWDGTGYGDDGTIWGGEFFLVENHQMRRFASLYPFKLTGGEKAVREPRYSALALLHAIWGDLLPSEYKEWLIGVFNTQELNLLLQALSKGINSITCSSMGRLFDGISALLGCCLTNQFEGHAAVMMEIQALNGQMSHAESLRLQYSIPVIKEGDLWLMDWRPLIPKIFAHRKQGMSLAEIAFAFHSALTDCIVEIARMAGQPNVLLTGGVMQNKLLTEDAIRKLRANGFVPYWHQNIPPNDGGVALGQLIAALNSNF